MEGLGEEVTMCIGLGHTGTNVAYSVNCKNQAGM